MTVTCLCDQWSSIRIVRHHSQRWPRTQMRCMLIASPNHVLVRLSQSQQVTGVSHSIHEPHSGCSRASCIVLHASDNARNRNDGGRLISTSQWHICRFRQRLPLLPIKLAYFWGFIKPQSTKQVTKSLNKS